jgi:hypothetical protein
MISNFYRGDTHLVPLIFVNSASDPIDIENWIFYLTLKLSPELSDTDPSCVQVKVNLSQSDPLGLIYRDLNAELGRVTVRLGPELTSKLYPDEVYFWDVQRSIPIYNTDDELIDHDVKTYFTGTVKILPDITRTFRQGELVVPD